MIPTLNVIFGLNKKITVKPIYKDIGELKSFLEDYLNYQVTLLTAENGFEVAILFVISIIIITALLKNVTNYLALYHVTRLRNGVLRDIREKLYKVIINLPISYYSEKRKGDIMSRMLGDVNEVKNSFFQVLELVVREPLTILFSIITMFMISAKLSLFVFLFIPVSGYIISVIGKNLRAMLMNRSVPTCVLAEFFLFAAD